MKKKYYIIIFIFIMFISAAVLLNNRAGFNNLSASTSILATNNHDRIHFINVGSGDSMLIESQGEFGLVDAGDIYENDNKNTYRYVQQVLGDRKLKFVILTHQHPDHVNGMFLVAKYFTDENTTFYVGENRLDTSASKETNNKIRKSFLVKDATIVEFYTVKNSSNKYDKKIIQYKLKDVIDQSKDVVVSNITVGTGHATIQSGTTVNDSNNSGLHNITIGNFKIKIMNRERDVLAIECNSSGSCKEPDDDLNKHSLIELITYTDPSNSNNTRKILLTGDMHTDDENRFLCNDKAKNGNQSECRDSASKNLLKHNIDIFKMGHHGSYTSSDQDFLNYIYPDNGSKMYVFINNRNHGNIMDSMYNYAAIYTLEKKGAKIYHTSYGETNGHDFTSTANEGQKAIVVNFSGSTFGIKNATLSENAPEFDVISNDSHAHWIKVKYYNDDGWIYLTDKTDSNTVVKTTSELVARNNTTGCYMFNHRSGVLYRGWAQSANGRFFYNDPDTGKRIVDSSKLPTDTGTYTVNSNSTCDNTHGYVNKNGWFTREDPDLGNYYWIQNGVVQTGWFTNNGLKYYLSENNDRIHNGLRVRGFNNLKSEANPSEKNWYYFKNNGQLVTNNSKTIGDKVFNFDSTGKCTNCLGERAKPGVIVCKNPVYNGSQQTITETLEETGTLYISKAYTFSNNSQKNVGTYAVKATLKDGYWWENQTTDPVTINCKILPKNIKDLSISIADQTYTGSALTPNPTIKMGSITLTKGTDYTVSYSNNTNVGTATVTITGKGNYTGTQSKTFRIKEQEITKIDKPTTDKCSNPTYNGSNQVITSSASTGYSFINNSYKDAGTYPVVARLSSGYAWKDGSTSDYTFNCSITAKDISSATVIVANQTYTGSALTPNPTVKVGSTTLTKGTDYTVSYSNNVNVGTATVTITGKGNYTGTASGSFTISSSIPEPTKIEKPANEKCSNPTYNGENQIITVSDNIGYTFINNSYKDAGTHPVTAVLSEGYVWQDNTTTDYTFDCSINPKDISSATVTVENQNYTGSALTPEPTVEISSTTLTKVTDYTVSYSDNVNVGTATVTITAKGNYTGTASGTFTISSSPPELTKIDKPTNSKCSNPTYNGENQVITESDEIGYTFLNNSYKDAGTYSVTARLLEGYIWEDDTTEDYTFECSIDAKDISSAIVTVANQTYTGSELTPEPTVEVDSTILTKETDYTVSYSDNVNVGEATVMIIATGNYTGIAAGTFTISSTTPEPTKIDKPTTDKCSNPTYNGTNQVITISPSTGYTFMNNSYKDAGTYSVTARLLEGYMWEDDTTEEYTFNCSITAKSISDATITVASQTYTGSALTPDPIVRIGSTTLTKETDYTVSYSNNVNVGTATVTITGKGNYTGAKVGTFTIVSPSITDITIIDTSDVTKDGNILIIRIPTGIKLTKSKVEEMISIPSNFTIKDKNNNEITASNQGVGTNSKIVSNDKTYNVVVRGDINGDGELSIIDLINIYGYMNEIDKGTPTKLNQNQIIACDFNRDNIVDILDLINVYNRMKSND